MKTREHGFSLFEILAAMAIVALAMVIAAPPVTNMLAKITFRKEVNEVMAQVRGWKLMAVSQGKPVTVTLEEDVLMVQLAQGAKVVKPFKPGVTLAMEPERIFFSPEGWATPATIEISSNERHRTLQINPLTGQPNKI
ncbi:MAG: GspH/FimT family pseudopilin [Thermodesulfobacteriota bacterium]